MYEKMRNEVEKKKESRDVVKSYQTKVNRDGFD